MLYKILLRAGQEEHLAKCNTYLIKELCKMLGLHTQFRHSSEMDIRGKGADLNLAIVQALQGDRYLAGSGSKKYEDPGLYTANGIELVYHDFGSWLSMHPYSQETDAFVNGLSVVDALMHIGADGIQKLFDLYQEKHDGGPE
jgi:hypothetical protein